MKIPAASATIRTMANARLERRLERLIGEPPCSLFLIPDRRSRIGATCNAIAKATSGALKSEIENHEPKIL
jgi:hypothetical protein